MESPFSSRGLQQVGPKRAQVWHSATVSWTALHIEPGLDSARVTVMLERPRRGLRVPLLVLLGIGLLGVFLPTAVVAIAALFGALGLMVFGDAPDRLELVVDAQGATWNGRRVQVRADYLYVWVDEKRYVLDGGFTKKEHQRLTALLEGRAKGDEADVPEPLRAIDRIRE